MAHYVIVRYWTRPLLVIVNEPIQSGMMDTESAFDMYGEFTGMMKRSHIYLYNRKSGKFICNIPLEHSYVEIHRDDDFPVNFSGMLKQKRQIIQDYITAKFGDIFLHPSKIATMPGKFCPQKYPRFTYLSAFNPKFKDIAYADRNNIS
jgi:hypothetical protein